MKKFPILTLLAMLILCVCLLPSEAKAERLHNMEVEVTILWNDQGNIHQDRPTRLYIVLQESATASAGYECTMTPANQSPSDPNVWKFTIQNVTYDTAETWFAHEHFLYEWGDAEENAFYNAYAGQYFDLMVESDTKATCTIQFNRKDTHSFTQEDAIAPYFSTAATCTTPDLYFKTCLCGEIGTETFPYGDTDPNEHDWGEFGYTWADDNSTCTALRTCAHNAEHVQTKTVNSSSEVTQEQTCTLPELTKYTAHSFGLSGALIQTKIDVQTKPAADHDWGDVYYISGFNDAGNRTLSAQRVCNTDSDHKETETVIATGVVTQQQTCAQSEITTYTGIFNNAAFGVKSFDVPTTPVGDHDWGEVNYIWADDNRSCTAERVCSYDTNRNHVETETVSTASEVTQNKTCSDPELSTYTAKFENTLFADQTKTNVQTAPALDHVWGEPTYTWSADNKTCTAERVCSHDSERDHVDSETVDTRAEVTQEKTETLPELTTYTAMFGSPVFEKQTKTDVKTAEPIHPDNTPAEVPSTGDSGMPLLWIVLIAVCIVGLFVVFFVRNMRKRR